ncbi:MAG: substrate-binding domain-containing protein [Chloroflexi bacterium]|nr:substrate-binding domain-containing protein [Chloroflexota bacterium]
MSDHAQHQPVTIGVLAGWQFYWTATPLSYLSPVFQGICQAAQTLGCNVLLSCGMGPSATSGDPLRPAWPQISSVADAADQTDFVPIGPWNTDGLIVINPLHTATRSRYIQDVRAAGHPVIFIGSGEVGPTIMADNESGILEAALHLLKHGHQRIAFIAGSREDLGGDTGERLRAYQFALRAYGLVADPRLIAYGQHVYAGGYAAMREIMAAGAPFTAVLASNDESALGAMQALKDAGRRIPQEVALIGFDDRPESAVQEPPLTSVHIPLFKMGYQALELLYQRLTANAPLPERVKIPTRLVTRESCGCGRSLVPEIVLSSTLDLTQNLTLAMLAETQDLSATQVQTLCQRLIDGFVASLEQVTPDLFRQTLDDLLRETAASQDLAVWQTAISYLRHALSVPHSLTAAELSPAALTLAHDLLDEARLAVSATLCQQHRHFVVDQRWQADRLGVLTARLLTALDEAEIMQILAHHLPETGIQTAAVAFYEAEGDDPVAWSLLRFVTGPEGAALRFRSREFPPAEGWPVAPPFTLVLLPLVNQSGRLGYVIFDAAQLELYGAIVQQLAAALNTARLYREATEGRRLAEEANRLKSRFLSTVSHELRTPLNLIVGLCGMLLQASAALPEASRRDVERIHMYAQQLSWLISDVLDLASSEGGQLRLTHEYVDLSETFHVVAETGRQLAGDKGLLWEEMLPAAGPWVWGDRTRLRQIALNLVTNAVKFTARGRVSLTVVEAGDRVTVTVRDTGLGVPPEEQPLVFDEFRRSERSIQRGYGGLGLGLAICKRLVELHGGVIGVRSSGEEGAGSTFYFTLPTVQPPVTEAPPLLPGPTVLLNVLVLTHPSEAGQRLVADLRQRGFAVQLALLDKAPDWLPQLIGTPPNAIVLDMTVAPERGWDMLKIIKGNATTQQIPVLFYSLAQDGGSLLELDYLTKPIELTELTRALDQQWLAADIARADKTILVVDDDPGTLEMHARIVQTHSPTHRVLQARNGREALAILQQEPVDLVLLDLTMPEMDGFAVLEAMREQPRTRDIPVIVVTGQVLTAGEMARLNRGVATVLGKGLFSVDETLAHIGAALEHKRQLNSEAQRLVRQAMAYIHEHYADPLTREDIARRVGLSEDYLTACFRQELGKTPIAYLNCYRVYQAKRLLKESDQTITDIAFNVGFSDSGYFARVFKREVGVSPQAYRRM